MNPLMNKALFEATARTFEELGFLQPIPEALHPLDASTSVVARVAFAGPSRGHLDVVVPGTLLPILAANMLGMDEAQPVSQQLDAFCEIANVITGHFLPDFAGPEAVFNLAPPKVFFGRDQPDSVAATASHAWVFFEEGPVETRFYLDQSPSSENVGAMHDQSTGR
jgi:CheY-specific phosphatase CheX